MLNPQYTSKDFKDRWSKQGYEDSTKYRCYKKIPTLFCTKLWFCAMFCIPKIIPVILNQPSPLHYPALFIKNDYKILKNTIQYNLYN